MNVSLSLPVLRLAVPFVVMLVVGVAKQEFRGSGFWFQLLVGSAVLMHFGLIR